MESLIQANLKHNSESRVFKNSINNIIGES